MVSLRLAPSSDYTHRVMTVHEKVKKPLGRPPGRVGTPKQVYLTDDLLDRVEDWRRQQTPIPTFSEAIRAILDEALPPRKKPPAGSL
jgi:hypothetical protein